MNKIDTLPLNAEELSQATSEDRIVRKLVQGLRHEQEIDAKDRFGIDQFEFSIQGG